MPARTGCSSVGCGQRGLGNVREELNQLERAVLAKLMDGDHPTLTQLRSQLDDARVLTREFSGVGFFTELRVISSKALSDVSASIRFGDVLATFDELDHGAGFLLYVDNGVINTLEGYTFGELWPGQPSGVQLSYTSTPRNLEDLPMVGGET